MRTGRPTAEVILTDEEREQLERWSRRPKTSQALAQRARIILACADGKSNDQIADRIGLIRTQLASGESALWRSVWKDC